MANTYFGYQKRDPQAEVNWAEVTKNLDTTLKEEVRVREEKKAAIDEATRKFQKSLNDVPQGESATLREWSLNYSSQAQEQMLMQERLLKSGALKYGDYVKMRQNLSDGTDEAFTLLQEYQDVYAKKMERMKSNDVKNASQRLEVWLMENAEGFGNFNRSELVINPDSGKVSAAFKTKNEKTGVWEISDNPNSLRSVSALRGQLLGEYNQYDIEGATKDFVDNTGAWETYSRTQGGRSRAGAIISRINPMIKTIDKEQAKLLGIDPNEVEDLNLYLKAENDWITSQMASPLNISSVLTDNINKTKDGNEYNFTYDVEEAKKNSNNILLDPATNQPIFDTSINPNAKEQEEDVRGYFRNSIRNKVSTSEKATTFREFDRETADETARADKDKQAKSFVGNVGKLYYGSDSEVKEAVDFLRSYNPSIETIDRTGDDIIITYNDGRPDERRAWRGADGEILDQTSWVTANTNFFLPKGSGIGNIDQIVKKAGIDDTKPFNEKSTGFSAADKQEQEPVDVAFKRVILENTDIAPESFVPNDRDKTKSNLQSFITGTPGLSGLTIKTGTFTDDTVTIMDGNKEVASFDLDGLDDLDEVGQKQAQSKMLQSLIELANNRATIQQKGTAIQGNRKVTKSSRQGREASNPIRGALQAPRPQ